MPHVRSPRKSVVKLNKYAFTLLVFRSSKFMVRKNEKQGGCPCFSFSDSWFRYPLGCCYEGVGGHLGRGFGAAVHCQFVGGNADQKVRPFGGFCAGRFCNQLGFGGSRMSLEEGYLLRRAEQVGRRACVGVVDERCE
jgi:hypothetical protein